MSGKFTRYIIAFVACAILAGCSNPGSKVTALKHFPIESADNVINRSNVSFDGKNSTDGNGSLMVFTVRPTVVRLYEVRDIDVENARLIYQAKLRTEGVEGQVYLEMWCHFPGKGEFFSRGLHSPLTGTTEWSTQEILFFLKKGENPVYVKLNLVVNGKGKAWIDDIRLFKGPLK
jgi:hypothetical protein